MEQIKSYGIKKKEA